MNYFIKIGKCSTQDKDLVQFENNLLEVRESMKFKNVKYKFLNKLHKDISSIQKSKNVFMFGGKTRNIHETDKNN